MLIWKSFKNQKLDYLFLINIIPSAIKGFLTEVLPFGFGYMWCHFDFYHMFRNLYYHDSNMLSLYVIVILARLFIQGTQMTWELVLTLFLKTGSIKNLSNNKKIFQLIMFKSSSRTTLYPASFNIVPNRSVTKKEEKVFVLVRSFYFPIKDVGRRF